MPQSFNATFINSGHKTELAMAFETKEQWTEEFFKWLDKDDSSYKSYNKVRLTNAINSEVVELTFARVGDKVVVE